MDAFVKFLSEISFGQFISYFWPFFVIDMVRYVFIDSILVFRHLIHKKRNQSDYQKARLQLFNANPKVSILVPGKNEGKHLNKLVDSLSEQTYKNFELIVVDDGSDDNTPEICKQLVDEGKINSFIRHDKRGGKASAANTAFEYSSGKYIVHLDADSYVDKFALEKILVPFVMDPNVGAVGGDVRVANETNSFATRLQTIEYFKTISVGRTASSMLNILRIVSGAHGAFRRDVLEQIKGWDVGPGLDGDLAIKIRKLGYDVVHNAEAIVYTNVPESFYRLSRQRYRWDKSLIRFRVRKHIDILKPGNSFRASNFFSVLENLLFNVFFDVKWFIYFIFVMMTIPQYLPFIFLTNYLLYFLANIIQYGLINLLIGDNRKDSDIWLAWFLPLMPIYTGIYLRVIRTYSYLMEFLHKTSYDDPWNPYKVSSIAKNKKL